MTPSEALNRQGVYTQGPPKVSSVFVCSMCDWQLARTSLTIKTQGGHAVSRP